jgi:hypothetical protein
MKVEFESLLKKALLKGCLWMGEGEGIPDGGQDEASQQLTASIQHFSAEENEAISLFI